MASNNLDYTKYSFDDAVSQLNDRVKELDGWKDTYLFGNGQVIVDLFAYTMNLVMYSIERRAEESYLDTARLRSSLVRLVSLLGYKVSRPISANGVVRVTIPSPILYDIYIPKWTQFMSTTGYVYLASQDYYLTAGNTYADVSVIQGKKGTLTVSGTGLTSQSINLPFINIENSSVVVTVDSVIWSEVDTFLNSLGTDTVYRIMAESDGTITLHFGDNSTGKAPDISSTIVITFVKSDGAVGNIYGAGAITTITDAIYDVQQNRVSNATVTNAESVLGASDEEGIEHIRFYAPKIFAAGQRGVTKQDFSALVGGYPGVADAIVWGEKENGIVPDYNQFNRVNICAILQGWLLADSGTKTAIGDFLKDYSMLTVKYEFTDATILNIIASVDLVCFNGSDLGQIRANSVYVLESLFNLGDTTKLGQVKPLSDLAKALSTVVGVIYSHVSMKIQNLMVWNSITSRWELTLPQLPVDPGSVEVIFNGVVVAKDDGFNSIKAISGGSVVGAVDYTVTGFAYTTVAGSNPSSQIFLRYRQPNGDIVPTKSGICRLYAVEFGSIGF